MRRRDFLRNAAVVSAISAFGIKPEDVLAADNGVLKVSMTTGDIQILDPGFMIGGAEVTLAYACLPRLAVPVKDASGNWGWEASDYVEKIAQDDPTHISFTLKPGFMWSNNGGEVTTDDVKYSFERMLKSDWATRWPTLDHVDIKDKYSGVIVLKAPFAATFLMGVASESGSIVPKVLTEKLQDQKFTTEYPAQCGPYMLSEWTPKQKVVIKADPGFKGTKPVFQEIHFINTEDVSAAALAYEAGELAITIVNADAAARYAKTMPEHSVLTNVPGPFYTWIGMNTEHPKLKDIRVRKAIQRAIDVKSILDAAYGGMAQLAHGVVPDGVTGHRSESKYSFNPDEARTLLKDAGVSGLELDFRTLNEAYRVTAAQVVQANLQDVGIKLNIIPTDSGPFWNLGLESKGDDWKNLEMWWMRFRASPDPSDALQWFVKSQIGVWNWERWTDPEFEDLWTKGLAETDPAKRDAIYKRMQEIMEDTGAYVWITHDPVTYIHRDDLKPEFESGGDYFVERFQKA